MNYYNENGIVGSYRDIDVYVIDEEEFTEDNGNNMYRIYAVRKKNSKTMLLVHNGLIIGTMDEDGLVKRARVQKTYQYYTPKKKKTVVKEAPPVKSEDIDFSDYSKEVDKFFEGLHELWKEMQV